MALLLSLCFMVAVFFVSELLITVAWGSYLLLPASSLFSPSFFVLVSASFSCFLSLDVWELCWVGVISERWALLKVLRWTVVWEAPR